MTIKKGQISMEVMYSVGVMLTIFIIITGISFSWRLQFSHTEEYLELRDECLKIANYISMVGVGGPGTYANTYLRERTDVSRKGYLTVGVTATGPGAVEVTCGFSANVRDTQLAPLQYHGFVNDNGNITIT